MKRTSFTFKIPFIKRPKYEPIKQFDLLGNLLNSHDIIEYIFSFIKEPANVLFSLMRVSKPTKVYLIFS